MSRNSFVMRSPFLTVALIFLTAIVLSAQGDLPKARLIDDLNTVGSNCEEGLAKMDGFLAALANDPAAQGYVILFQEGNNPRSTTGRERELMNWISFRNFDRNRITFGRGTGQVDARTQFWLVPAGAENPEIVAADPKALEMPAPPEPVESKPTKPYIFTSEYADGVDGCKDPFDKAGFAAELKANPGYRGNIVIRASEGSLFRDAEKEILDELASYGVPRSRLRTFFVKDILWGIELWILPHKK